MGKWENTLDFREYSNSDYAYKCSLKAMTNDAGKQVSHVCEQNMRLLQSVLLASLSWEEPDSEFGIRVFQMIIVLVDTHTPPTICTMYRFFHNGFHISI